MTFKIFKLIDRVVAIRNSIKKTKFWHCKKKLRWKLQDFKNVTSLQVTAHAYSPSKPTFHQKCNLISTKNPYLHHKTSFPPKPNLLPGNGTCQACLGQCADCSSGVGCKACKHHLLLHRGRCLVRCPGGTFEDGNGWVLFQTFYWFSRKIQSYKVTHYIEKNITHI